MGRDSIPASCELKKNPIPRVGKMCCCLRLQRNLLALWGGLHKMDLIISCFFYYVCFCKSDWSLYVMVLSIRTSEGSWFCFRVFFYYWMDLKKEDIDNILKSSFFLNSFKFFKYFIFRSSRLILLIYFTFYDCFKYVSFIILILRELSYKPIPILINLINNQLVWM